jgi:hypothetical protein
MVIKVSKVFAKFINATAKELGFKCKASVITIPAHGYTFITGVDLWDGECDYAGNGMYKVIYVEYPYEYYACARHLTTYELVREFRQRGVKTVEELKEMLRDMLEI